MDTWGVSLVVLAVVTLALAQLLDLATFIEMVRRVGIHAEANPIVAAAYGAHGLELLTAIKVALMALTTSVALVLFGGARRPRMAAVILALGIAVGVLGGLANAIALLS